MARIVQIIKDFFRGYKLGGRSSEWPRVRKEHLKKNPVCASCGRDFNLEVHHKKPYHLYPELELDPDNLITLCDGPTMNCHYVIGHGYNGWKGYNPNVELDAWFIHRLRKMSKEK